MALYTTPSGRHFPLSGHDVLSRPLQVLIKFDAYQDLVPKETTWSIEIVFQEELFGDIKPI